MVEGFTLETAPGGYMVSRWLRGRPRKSWWRGVRTKDVECRAIETYRCESCGLLRSYAVDTIGVEEVLPEKWARRDREA